MSEQISRRTFFQGTAAGLAATILARNVFGANDKLCHAAIGSGGMGGGDLGAIKGHPKAQIVALCDVDANTLKAAAAKYVGARTYADWREMLDKEGDQIDSVNVSTPDHTHAPATMTALRKKKHVYCQKPLTHDVYESRQIAAAAKAAGVTTQLGTQAASGIGDRMAVAFLRQGVIGKAKRAILCSNRPGAIEHYRLKGPRPPQGETPPPHLSWDLWLGTAPERPYAGGGIYHPVRWRAWQDFGTGWSGDIGCHIFDAVWKGLRLTAPKTVTAEVQKSWLESPERRADTWPQGDHITWVFPASEATEGDLTLEWFDGEFYPPDDVQKLAGFEAGKPGYPPESAMVIGTEGALLLQHGAGPQLFPKEKFAKIERPKLPGRDHYHHFVDACLGGEPTESHFMQVGPMAEAILLGTVAIRVPNTLLEWDAANLKVTNSDEAQRLLRRTYRKGWEVEGL
ncbi:MAG TPA: Gfo/Idh/MocA family oxidoreductase [Planctomycetota bacterium]|nr:Gfo/Idh/MocA family oxidoreductase [Planctomycetota bacterium]HRR79791.1 Gfo/Idh/MocA family oxidoreductase [Planctomycetota bacterium]HRT95813.1 Gfo/Idh/MocA family oxidoreductase [Planctomycetota bacterium]